MLKKRIKESENKLRHSYDLLQTLKDKENGEKQGFSNSSNEKKESNPIPTEPDVPLPT